MDEHAYVFLWYKHFNTQQNLTLSANLSLDMRVLLAIMSLTE